MKSLDPESTILDYEEFDDHILHSTFHIKSQFCCSLEKQVQKWTPTTLQILCISKFLTNRQLPGLLNEDG